MWQLCPLQLSWLNPIQTTCSLSDLVGKKSQILCKTTVSESTHVPLKLSLFKANKATPRLQLSHQLAGWKGWISPSSPAPQSFTENILSWDTQGVSTSTPGPAQTPQQSKYSWSSGSFGVVTFPEGAWAVSQHPLGKKSLPNIQPKVPQTQLQPYPQVLSLVTCFSWYWWHPNKILCAFLPAGFTHSLPDRAILTQHTIPTEWEWPESGKALLSWIIAPTMKTVACSFCWSSFQKQYFTTKPLKHEQ